MGPAGGKMDLLGTLYEARVRGLPGKVKLFEPKRGRRCRKDSKALLQRWAQRTSAFSRMGERNPSGSQRPKQVVQNPPGSPRKAQIRGPQTKARGPDAALQAIKPSFEWRPMEAERQYDPNIHRLDHYGMKKKRAAFMMCVTEGRAGAEEDIKKMKKWFRKFKFTLLGDCRNPGQETLMQQLRQFRDIINLSNEEISCCLITLMSHGKANGYILDKDNREISLDGIFSLFNNKTCPKLQGKPKIFIIQACRGEQRDYGTLVAGGKPVEPDTWSRPKLPTVSDYFIVYSSQRDHIAVRDENTGSEMISAMDEVFSEHGTQWHIGDLFTKVNSKMIQRDFHLEGEEESVKVTIVMESTLTKALYLSAD